MEDMAWEVVESYLKKTKKKVDDKTKLKMYKFALYKLKQTEEGIREIFKIFRIK